LSFSVQVCILRLVCWNLIYPETSQMQQTSSQQPQEQLQQQQQQSQQQQMQQVLAHISCSAFESWFKWTPC
jgi:serine phosphatase RsbU (regulator of sigma subunit)